MWPDDDVSSRSGKGKAAPQNGAAPRWGGAREVLEPWVEQLRLHTRLPPLSSEAAAILGPRRRPIAALRCFRHSFRPFISATHTWVPKVVLLV